MMNREQSNLLLDMVRREIRRVAKAKEQTENEELKKMYENKQLQLIELKNLLIKGKAKK